VISTLIVKLNLNVLPLIEVLSMSVVKRILFAIAIAATMSAQSAFAQEPEVQPTDRTVSASALESFETKGPTRAQVRHEWQADQRTLLKMQQRATGEYRARPTVRFPNHITYQPIMYPVRIVTPYGWYSYGWY
jgi:hypothetical protein